VNPALDKLQAYPFERLRRLFDGVQPAAGFQAIRLSIGEPQHTTPHFIREHLTQALDALANYPTTRGGAELRTAIAEWLQRRYRLPAIDPETQVLPVNGSREALFAIAQCVVDASRPGALVAIPNPFYQIYEGAALLAGAAPLYLNQQPEDRYAMPFGEHGTETWSRVQLIYVCSPGNPTGRVMTIEEWRTLFELSDRHGFVIAADECYSEIHFDDEHPPLGALEAAQACGREDFRRLLAFSSLSKRSNVPGMRSGFVSGDAALLRSFLTYRTYHGCAMSLAVQHASAAAWCDEAHVAENRKLYRTKFAQVMPLLAAHLEFDRPDAGFYLWARTPIADPDFARGLYRAYNVSVLPGSFLARTAGGINPGAGFVRIALVAPPQPCVEAARRIASFCNSL